VTGPSPEGITVVNSVKHSLLLAVAILALLFGPASQVVAQSSTADELNKKVNELYRAGKFAEAIPLAQEVLTKRVKRG
jgi:hypothetical protein